ncbi:MAG: hypothetical protein JNK15_15870 [Planctomycetes bacterium]|nr:hypothetical protein [Planctomycetota bacterium]
MNPHPTCSKTDAVLAYHLDGDLDDRGLHDAGFGFACGASLHDHLRECRVCQGALQRARRLDAALATASGAHVARHPAQVGSTWTATSERWLAHAIAAPAAVVPAPAARPVAVVAATSRPRRGAVVGAAAAALLAGALAMWPHAAASAPDRTTAATAEPVPDPVPEPVAVPEATSVAPLPIPAPLPLKTSPRPAPLRPDALAACIGDAKFPAAERLAATRLLVLACRGQAPNPTRALRALVPVLAACGDRGPLARDLHTRMLELVRAHDDVVALLQSSVALLESSSRRLNRDELGLLTVAARLDRPELDRTLRRVLRQKTDAIDAIAAAMRCGVRPQGGARLLLDAWTDAAARDATRFDDRTAMAWFRCQPDRFVAELTDLLRSERNADRRIRIVLALGGTDAAAAASPLFAALHATHHDEALAAAFALSHLPPDVLEDLAREHGTDGEPMLRLALARADAPIARPWLLALDLSPRDLARLRHGDRRDLADAITWFRERAALGD